MTTPSPTKRTSPLRLFLLFSTSAIAAFFAADLAVHRLTPAHAEAPAAAPPAVPVGVQTIGTQAVRIWSTFSGRLHAVDSADIRPEVSGRITEVRIKDGQTVKAGDVLFVIDPS